MIFNVSLPKKVIASSSISIETNSQKVYNLCKSYLFQFLESPSEKCSWSICANLVSKSEFSEIRKSTVLLNGQSVNIYPGTPAVFFDYRKDHKKIFIPSGILVMRNKNTIEIIGCNEGELSLRTYTSIRSIMEELLFSLGFSMIHASCVSFKDKGVIFLGDKGAGKTTFLLFLLESNGVFVGNDRLFIRFNKSSVEIIPRPSLTRVGMGTALNIPRLKNLVPKQYQDLNREQLMKMDDKLDFPNFPLIFEYPYMQMTTLKHVVVSSIASVGSTILRRENDWGIDMLEKNYLKDFPGLLTWKYLFNGKNVPMLFINESHVSNVEFLECLGMPSNDLLRYLK